jgi:predicted outer membrane repeat protein
MTRRQRQRRQGRRKGEAHRARNRIALGAGLTLGAVLGTGGAAQAAVFEVENLDASGEGSLRDAIADANAIPADPDVITFQSGLSGQIALGGTALSITSPLQVVGPEGGEISINAENQSRVAEINTPADTDLVRFANLAIFSGETADPAGGGGIHVLNGDLTLDTVTLEGNYATGVTGGGALRAMDEDSDVTVIDSQIGGRVPNGVGGALVVDSGSLTITGSTISDSFSGDSDTDGFGGAIVVGTGDLSISRSTISGNEARGTSPIGGAIGLGPATATIEDSTITDNQANEGGGISGQYGGTINLESTILSGNEASVNDDLFRAGATVNSIASLFGDNDSSDINGVNEGNIFGEGPGVGSLQQNGGPTPTHKPQAFSPGLDQGTGTGSDQRGAPRPVDLPIIGNSEVSGANGSDIGAVELQAFDNEDQEVTNLDDSGAGSLRAAVIASNDVASPNDITFDSELEGTIPLTSGELTVQRPVSFEGPGADQITVSGTDSQRILTVDTNDEEIVEINGLTLADGSAMNPGGGAIFQSSGELRIADSEFTGNEVEDGSAGGAILTSVFSDALVIEGSTFSGNEAERGGAIFTESELDLRSSTLSGNGASGIAAGGGIYFAAEDPSLIDSSTIAGNVTGPGTGNAAGGVYVRDSPYTATLTVANSIVAGNTAPSGPDLSGEVDAEFSLFGALDAEGTVTPTVPDSNLIGEDPELGPLELNGGTTRTRALLSTSPAIDTGSATADDQRGVGRPLDYPFVPNSAATGANGADIGAFELTGLTEPGSGQTPVNPIVEPAPDPKGKKGKKKCKKPKGKKKKCKKKRKKKK